MNLQIHHTFLPHTDPEQSLAFYRDVLEFDVLNDVGYEGMRWITVAPKAGGTSVVLYPPGADPGITDAEKNTIVEMMAKGTFASLVLATDALDAAFQNLERAGVEVVQEPTDQPYGIRDCAVRDPAGNMVRVQEIR